MKPKKTDLLAAEVRQLAFSATNPVEKEILLQAAVRLKDLALIADFFHHEITNMKKEEAQRKHETS